MWKKMYISGFIKYCFIINSTAQVFSSGALFPTLVKQEAAEFSDSEGPIILGSTNRKTMASRAIMGDLRDA